MKKNYALTSQIALSFLLVLSFTFSALAQSKTGKKSSRTEDVSKRPSVENVSRISPGAPITQATTTVTACGSYVWPVNG